MMGLECSRSDLVLAYTDETRAHLAETRDTYCPGITELLFFLNFNTA